MVKNQLIKSLFLCAFLLIFSCKDDIYHKFSDLFQEEEEEEDSLEIPLKRYINLHAPFLRLSQINGINIFKKAYFVKFAFTEGKNGSIVENDNENWDIAFRGKTIILNGGSSNKDNISRTKEVKLACLDQTFEEVVDIPNEANFFQDSNDTYALGNNWYTYSIDSLSILPINKTFIIKTHNDKYVKMKIRSYYRYESTPTLQNILIRQPGYYSFEFKVANENNKFEIIDQS